MGKKAQGRCFSPDALYNAVSARITLSAVKTMGPEIPVERLAEIFLELQGQGAHNINLVSAGHYAPWVAEAPAPVRG